ncbi:MAG: ATP-binding cassette domain-containing protein [Gemmatimonadetes bacterium]|nr:ATP-binding cassette domain-containing protein [Gemmatimonadota bacterium]
MTLDIRHDAIRRAGRTVLEAGSITVGAPAALAIVGINGSGKSSLFMQLTDTLSSRGSAVVTLDGRSATLAYVPQSPGLPDWLRTERIADMYGLAFDALVDAMPGLHLAEIAGQRASTLSLGQRQVLAIAIALGRDADVTFLDEPFSALDFRRRLGTMELLRERRDAGRGVVLSSQAASDLIELCDRFVVLRDGRYIFNGRRQDLAADADVREVELRLLHLLTMPA